MISRSFNLFTKSLEVLAMFLGGPWEGGPHTPSLAHGWVGVVQGGLSSELRGLGSD